MPIHCYFHNPKLAPSLLLIWQVLHKHGSDCVFTFSSMNPSEGRRDCANGKENVHDSSVCKYDKQNKNKLNAAFYTFVGKLFFNFKKAL